MEMKTIKNNFTGKGKYKMEFIIQIAIKLTIGFTALLIYMNINGKGQLAPVTATDQIGNYVLGGIIGGVQEKEKSGLLPENAGILCGA